MHDDGTFTLGAASGPAVSPEDILSRLRPLALDYSNDHHVILDAPDDALIANWGPVLNAVGEAGWAKLQLRVGRDTLNFHIPAGIEKDSLNDPVFIDLRTGLEDFDFPDSKFDIVMIVDSGFTCQRVLDAARPYQKPNSSMLVTGGGMYLIRSAQEEESHRPRKEPSLWSRAKQWANSLQR